MLFVGFGLVLVLAIALRLERIVLDRMSILVEFDLAFRMRLIEALGVPGLTPLVDGRVGAAMVHMVDTLRATQRHAFLGHGDLVHIRR